MISPPRLTTAFEELPGDPKQRHEALVDAFGEYIVWVRQQTLMRSRRLVESREAREELGRIFRDAYEEASTMSTEDRERSYRLVESGVDFFARLFLTMVSGTGFDHPFGPKHAVRFRIEMEICDGNSGEVVEEETINRKGAKFFPDYWGRWLNRAKANPEDAAPDVK